MTGLRFHPYMATVRFHQPTTDHKSQPNPPNAAGALFQALEGAEELLLVSGGNTDALVTDPDNQVIPLRLS